MADPRTNVVEALREQYKLLHDAMEEYYSGLSRRICSEGKTIQKETSNRGLGALRARDEKVQPIFDGILKRDGRQYASSIQALEEAFDQLLRAARRYCQRGEPWLLARERVIKESVGYLRGFGDAAKVRATTATAPEVSSKASSVQAESTEKKPVSEGKTLSDKPPSGPVPSEKKPEGKPRTVAHQLYACLNAAVKEHGVDPKLIKAVFTTNTSLLKVRVPSRSLETVFSAREHHLSYRAACKRINDLVRSLKDGAPVNKTTLPAEQTLPFILSTWGVKPEEITLHEVMRRLEEKYEVPVNRRAEIGRDHKALVLRAVEAGIVPAGDVLKEHGIPTPEAPSQPSGATLESLTTLTAEDEAFLKDVAELPYEDAEKRVVALEKRSNKHNKGIASVFDGTRKVGVTTNMAQLNDIATYNKTHKPEAKSLKVQTPAGMTNAYLVYYLAPNEAFARKFAEDYGALMHDEMRDRKSVTPERYADISRRLGYSDEQIREWFLARRARKTLNARKEELPREKPVEVRFARIDSREAGDFVELAFTGKPPKETYETLTGAGFTLVNAGPDAPFWRALADEKTLSAAREFSPSLGTPRVAEAKKEAKKESKSEEDSPQAKSDRLYTAFSGAFLFTSQVADLLGLKTAEARRKLNALKRDGFMGGYQYAPTSATTSENQWFLRSRESAAGASIGTPPPVSDEYSVVEYAHVAEAFGLPKTTAEPKSSPSMVEFIESGRWFASVPQMVWYADRELQAAGKTVNKAVRLESGVRRTAHEYLVSLTFSAGSVEVFKGHAKWPVFETDEHSIPGKFEVTGKLTKSGSAVKTTESPKTGLKYLVGFLAETVGAKSPFAMEDEVPATLDEAKGAAVTRGIDTVGGEWVVLDGFPHFIRDEEGKLSVMNVAKVGGDFDVDRDFASDKAREEYAAIRRERAVKIEEEFKRRMSTRNQSAAVSEKAPEPAPVAESAPSVTEAPPEPPPVPTATEAPTVAQETQAQRIARQFRERMEKLGIKRES